MAFIRACFSALAALNAAGALAIAPAVAQASGKPQSVTVGEPTSPQNYRAAYEHALRCFVVTSSYSDETSARRSFDAAMRLGQLQNLSNRQLNADLNRSTAYEGVRLVRDRRYRDQLLAECRRLGLAS